MIPWLVLLAFVVLVARWVVMKGEVGRVGEDHRFTQAAAEMLGRAMAERVPEDGPVLIVAEPPRTEEALQRVRLQVQGLEAGWGVRHLRAVGIPEAVAPWSAEDALTEPSFSWVDVAAQRQAVPDAVAVVLCVPWPSAAVNGRLPGRKTMWYVLEDQYDAALASLLRRGVLDAGVFWATGVDLQTESAKEASVEELFDMRYRLAVAPN